MPPTFHDQLSRQELRISFLSATEHKKKGYMLVLNAQSKDLAGLSMEYIRVVPSNFDIDKVLEREERDSLMNHISLKKAYDLQGNFDEQYKSSAVLPSRTLWQKIFG